MKNLDVLFCAWLWYTIRVCYKNTIVQEKETLWWRMS